MPDDTQKKEIPFSGKWMTADPATIGMNFRTLTNMRYTDSHVKAVQGMTKVNVSAAMNGTYIKTRNAFHFKKSQPAESHVLVQAYNAGLTASQILDNTTAIPNTGSFAATELWTDSAGAGRGFFSNAPDGQMIYCNGVDVCMWAGNEDKIGAFVVSSAAVSAAGRATNPADYTDIINNTKQGTQDIAYITTSAQTFLIGTKRPVQGFKIYILNANTVASTMTGSCWDGDSWDALSVTDNTDTGASLAVTGTVTFATTVGTAKPKYLEGYYLYWYQFTIDAGSATIYKVSCDAPFQALTDMWDGIFRDITACLLRTTSYMDVTTKVLMDDYDSGDNTTYVDMSSLAAFNAGDNCLELGFPEKQIGLHFIIPPEYTNSTAATTMTVDYWNGTAYATVGTIVDGTAEGGVSFAKSGAVTWDNSAFVGEIKTNMFGNQGGVTSASTPMYAYRVRWNDAMDASVRLQYIGGIQAAKDIGYFKFPVFAQGRILLCGDMSNEKNKAVVSSKYMPQVYNGTDSVDVYFGDDGELSCGTELFSQFGSSLYSLVLMFKDTETWVMAGQDINAWADNTFLLSSSIGCADPLTLKTINLHAEPGAGVNRALAIWRGTNGVYMSDGRAPIPIHGDIKEYFDPEHALYIASDGTANAFMDPVKQEYHLILNATTEVVYDIARNKWFNYDRETGNYLQCGVTVHDAAGNAYCYGFIDTGYMERLENGATFDGTDIAPAVQFGDMPLGGLDIETRVSDVTLFTVAKTNAITCTHYGDTSSTGTAKTMDHTSTNRLAMPDFDEMLNGYFHSLKYSTTGPFEPIATVIWYHAL